MSSRKLLDHDFYQQCCRWRSCAAHSGIGVATLFGEQIALKASNQFTEEIKFIENRKKPKWLPSDPLLDLSVKTKLVFERFKAKTEI